MSKLEVDAIEPQSGTTITIGSSGDTVNLVGTLNSNGSPLPGDISSVVAGTGLSGGGTTGAVTLNIEAAQPTITSTGTLTGFTSTGIDDNADATAITINSSESVGIGETSPLAKLHVKIGDSGASANAGGNEMVVEDSAGAGISILSGNTSKGQIIFGDDGDDNAGRLVYDHSDNNLASWTNGSERMRIDSSGNVAIATTSAVAPLTVASGSDTGAISLGGDVSSSGITNNTRKIGRLVVPSYATAEEPVGIILADFNGTDNQIAIGGGSSSVNSATKILFLTSTNDTTASGSERMRITSGGTVFVSNTSEPSGGDNGAQISNSSYHIFCRNTSGAAVFRTFGSSGEFRTLGNGNAQNTNNSYGAISDRELKENEVDANSQWNDIKSLQIKHYNFKSKPNEKQLGVIAQDLEASGMNGLVENNQDELYTEDDVLPEGKNIGDVKLKNYKSVKYSILYMKSVKALQEAMTRIESLEAEVTALKNQP